MPVTLQEHALWGRALVEKQPAFNSSTVPGTNPRDLMRLYEGPSLFVQPRLPGTVVGEVSIRLNPQTGKVTCAIGPRDRRCHSFGNC